MSLAVLEVRSKGLVELRGPMSLDTNLEDWALDVAALADSQKGSFAELNHFSSGNWLQNIDKNKIGEES